MHPYARLALLSLLVVFSTGGLCDSGPSLPVADTCNNPGNADNLDTLEIGPNLSSDTFTAWKDGDTLVFTVGGQGTSMASIRLHITGGGEPGCIPQTVTFRDKAGDLIATTASVGGLNTYPDSAGGRTTKALYIPGSYPMGERLTVSATVGNRTVTRTLAAGQLLTTCAEALACLDSCTTTATCSACGDSLSNRASSLMYRITSCQELKCSAVDGGSSGRLSCQRDTLRGADGGVADGGVADGGVACSQPVTSKCGACLAERATCEADL